MGSLLLAAQHTVGGAIAVKHLVHGDLEQRFARARDDENRIQQTYSLRAGRHEGVLCLHERLQTDDRCDVDIRVNAAMDVQICGITWWAGTVACVGVRRMRMRPEPCIRMPMCCVCAYVILVFVREGS